jgi:hypothetical protein
MFVFAVCDGEKGCCVVSNVDGGSSTRFTADLRHGLWAGFFMAILHKCACLLNLPYFKNNLKKGGDMLLPCPGVKRKFFTNGQKEQLVGSQVTDPTM